MALALISECVERATALNVIWGFDVERAQVIEGPSEPRLAVYMPVAVGGAEQAMMCSVYGWPASATIDEVSFGAELTGDDLQKFTEAPEDYFTR